MSYRGAGLHFHVGDEDEGWVGVTCLMCPTGAEYIPEQGPGTGWALDRNGWLCPSCSEATLNRLQDERDDAIEALEDIAFGRVPGVTFGDVGDDLICRFARERLGRAVPG